MNEVIATDFHRILAIVVIANDDHDGQPDFRRIHSTEVVANDFPNNKNNTEKMDCTI